MNRKQIIYKVFSKKHTLHLSPDAIQFLEEILEEHEIPDNEVQESLEVIAKQYSLQDETPPIVTKKLLAKVYETLQGSGEERSQNTLGDELDPEHHLFFIDAFDMPSWHYSAERQTFEKAHENPGIGGSAASRIGFLRDRYNIIKQIVLRNENFSPPAIAGRDRDTYFKLTSTKHMLGRAGQRFLLFGMLTHSPDGRLCLEDLDGRVPLDISETGPSEGLFTEGCFVLVEGEYTDDEVLVVIALGHPPSEKREVARSIYGHIDFLGKGATTVMEDADYARRVIEFPTLSFLLLSDLWLDHPRSLGGLRKVLTGCVENDFIPLVFVLCGNFTQSGVSYTSGTGISRYNENFDALADLLVSFPQVCETSHFVFVPGPLDPWGSSTLPRPPLPSSFVSRLKARIPKAHFMTNPCRIKFLGQELVIFREDVMARMLRNLVGVKPDVPSTDLKRYLVQTILDQCHLSPLPLSVQSTLWEYDHTMRLYPMPTALILADKYERYELTYEGCHVFNPGSFVGTTFGFSTYFPARARSEASVID